MTTTRTIIAAQPEFEVIMAPSPVKWPGGERAQEKATRRIIDLRSHRGSLSCSGAADAQGKDVDQQKSNR